MIFFVFFWSFSGFSVVGVMSVLLFVVVTSVDVGCDGDRGTELAVEASTSEVVVMMEEFDLRSSSI